MKNFLRKLVLYLSKIILSIKPCYASKIFSGEKKFEYRKKKCKYEVTTVYVYSSNPIRKVIGEFTVKRIICGRPSDLWEETYKYSGIDKNDYNKYFYNCEIGYAYVIDKIIMYEIPKDLIEFGIVHVPQSFVYVNNNSIKIKCKVDKKN